eukprot:UN14359
MYSPDIDLSSRKKSMFIRYTGRNVHQYRKNVFS